MSRTCQKNESLLIESKFKKLKKQPSSGFYTSLERKKIKFFGRIEKQTGEKIHLNNSSFTRKTDVLAKNKDHEMLLVYIEKILKLLAINSKADELVANFCTGLYHLTIPPGKTLNETAIKIDEQHKLTWFDIETLNNAPTAETLKQM